MNSKGVSLCLQCGALVFGVTCGQIISNELCKSPQSNAGWQWVMLTTPSQGDYMNIFIGQQKAEETRRKAFFQSHGGQFICTDDTQGWFFNSHLRRFSIEMLCLDLAVILGGECMFSWRPVIHLCFINKIFVFIIIGIEVLILIMAWIFISPAVNKESFNENLSQHGFNTFCICERF